MNDRRLQWKQDMIKVIFSPSRVHFMLREAKNVQK